MSWRTVVISGRCKLDLKMGYMSVRGEETKKIFLDEIALLLIEDPAVSMTGCLLEALVEKKVRVIFCGGKRSPFAELVPYCGAHDSSRKIREQCEWSEPLKAAVWTEIITEKICNQHRFLSELGKTREAGLLGEYIEQIEPGDATNREGHAAKVYFNGLFGMDFTRDADSATNAALNYGYSIILSAFNREITCCGYLTQLGLFHRSVFNHYNLSSDLMEPFRILVDRKVCHDQYTKFTTVEKHDLLNILNGYVLIDGAKQTVLNAVKIYVYSVFEALRSGNLSLIKFYGNL
jgi:CRISP-associated protein Cas1